VSNQTFLRVLEELDWPRVYLLSTEQFEKVDGSKIESDFGVSSVAYPVITIKKGLRGKVLLNVLYHEIGHILFPHRPHWWIECAAERLAGGGGKGYYSKKHEHSVDEMPTRSRLLKTFKIASKRFNER
jgi:hypothetical protein